MDCCCRIIAGNGALLLSGGLLPSTTSDWIVAVGVLPSTMTDCCRRPLQIVDVTTADCWRRIVAVTQANFHCHISLLIGLSEFEFQINGFVVFVVLTIGSWRFFFFLKVGWAVWLFF
jgi:hypothetical protein